MGMKFHYKEALLTDAAAAGGTVNGAWQDTQGAGRISAYAEHLLFNGTMVIQGSFDAKTNHGTVATVTPGTLDVNGTVACVPYVRLAVTTFNSGTVSNAWLYGTDA